MDVPTTEERQTSIPIAASGKISSERPDRSSSPVIQRKPSSAMRIPKIETHEKAIFMRDVTGGTRDAEYAAPKTTIAANETNRIRPVIDVSIRQTPLKTRASAMFNILP
jgi:hypothetical protein